MTAKQLSDGSEEGKAWLHDQIENGGDGLKEWSTFINDRLNAEILPSFFKAYKEEPRRPSKNSSDQMSGSITVQLIAARGLHKQECEAYGVFECEDEDNSTTAVPTVTGQVHWDEQSKHSFQVSDVHGEVWLRIFDNNVEMLEAPH